MKDAKMILTRKNDICKNLIKFAVEEGVKYFIEYFYSDDAKRLILSKGEAVSKFFRYPLEQKKIDEFVEREQITSGQFYILFYQNSDIIFDKIKSELDKKGYSFYIVDWNNSCYLKEGFYEFKLVSFNDDITEWKKKVIEGIKRYCVEFSMKFFSDNIDSNSGIQTLYENGVLIFEKMHVPFPYERLEELYSLVGITESLFDAIYYKIQGEIINEINYILRRYNWKLTFDSFSNCGPVSTERFILSPIK